jgi:hypothetical protein
MMRALLPAAILLAACTTPPGPESAPPAAYTGEEEAILRTVDRFMLAVGNHDAESMRDIMLEEGVAWFQNITPGGANRVQPFPNSTMLEEPDADSDPFIERYWDPIIQLRGGVASVWAPYELRDNGAVIHCGIDTLYLVKLSGAWRIANIMSTMEPDSCEELRPSSASAMRPQNGWKETPLQ